MADKTSIRGLSLCVVLCALVAVALTAPASLPPCGKKNDIPTYRDPEGMCSQCTADACKAINPTPNECLCHCQSLFPNKTFQSEDGHTCPVIPKTDKKKEKDEELKDPVFFDGKGILLTIGWILAVVQLVINICLIYKFRKQIYKKIGQCMKRRQDIPERQVDMLLIPVERGMTKYPGDPSILDSGFNSIPGHLDGQPNGINVTNVPPHRDDQPNGINVTNVPPHRDGQPNGINVTNVPPHRDDQPNGINVTNVPPHRDGQPNGINVPPHRDGQPNGRPNVSPHRDGQPNGRPNVPPHRDGQPNGINVPRRGDGQPNGSKEETGVKGLLIEDQAASSIQQPQDNSASSKGLPGGDFSILPPNMPNGATQESDSHGHIQQPVGNSDSAKGLPGGDHTILPEHLRHPQPPGPACFS